MEDNVLVNIGLWAAYVLFIVALISAVVLPLINAMSNPKSLLFSLGGIAILGVIFLVGWVLSGDEVTAKYISKGVESASVSKLIGGGLTMMYILFIIAVVGIVFSEINKALK
ncbi:MAG: hypothetical protein OEY34_07565 [Cyclobacteriaceae bacterium]|nr:hypothetical protein [Cyclobacteriaceae bacterium]